MNSRKQVSNGYDDTSTGDEQIRPVVFNSSRRSWMETNAGNPGLVLEDGRMMRRTEDEDEDNTLGMTQRVSTFNNRAQSMGRTERVSPMVSERDWTRKCSGADEGLGWWGWDEVQVRLIGAQVKSGVGGNQTLPPPSGWRVLRRNRNTGEGKWAPWRLMQGRDTGEASRAGLRLRWPWRIEEDPLARSRHWRVLARSRHWQGAGTGGRWRGAGTGGRWRGAGTGGRWRGAGTGGRSGSAELDGTSGDEGELDGTSRGEGELDGTSRGDGELDGLPARDWRPPRHWVTVSSQFRLEVSRSSTGWWYEIPSRNRVLRTPSSRELARARGINAAANSNGSGFALASEINHARSSIGIQMIHDLLERIWTAPKTSSGVGPVFCYGLTHRDKGRC